MADSTELVIVKYVAEVEGLKAGLKSVQASVAELTKSNEELAKKLNDTFEKPIEKTKSLKAQLRELKAQLAEATDPKDIERLAKAAGALTDQIQDAGDAAKVFASESKFEQIGTALGGVGGKLRNLDFKGALDQSKLLVSATKGLTFKEGLQGIKDLGGTLLNVGKSLLGNPIFLLGSAIALIVTNFEKLTKAGGLVGQIFGGIGKLVNGIIGGFESLGNTIGLVNTSVNKFAEDNKMMFEDTAKFIEDINKSLASSSVNILKNQGKVTDDQAKLLALQDATLEKFSQNEIARQKARAEATKKADLESYYNIDDKLKAKEDLNKQLEIIDKNFAKKSAAIAIEAENLKEEITSGAIQRKAEEDKKAAEAAKKQAEADAKARQKAADDEWKKLKDTRDKALKEMGTLDPLTISAQSVQNQDKLQKDLEDKLKKSQETITKNFKEETDKRDAAAAEAANKQKKYDEDVKRAKEQILSESIQTANQLLDFYQESQQRKADEQVEIAKKETDSKIQNYQEQLDSNLISKKRYDQLVEKENKKLDAEAKKIQKEAYERNKQIQLIQAIINGASAVINSLNSAPAPYNFVLAALTGAAVAIQIAEIENAPPPKFEKGGKVKGERHFAGGTLIEAEKDEFIINRKEAIKHDRLLEAINNGRAEKYIHEMYLAPVLKQTAKRIKEQQQKDFATNIANSMMLQGEFKDVNILDSLKMSRQNDREIAQYIVKHISPNVNKYNW